MMMGCKDSQPNSNRLLTLEYYQDFNEKAYAVNSKVIRGLMDSLMQQDKDRLVADLHTRKYYQHRGGFLWIDRHGIDHRADSLLAYLRNVEEIGFNKQRFYVDEIAEDIERLRTLHLDRQQNQVNRVMARLEYRLTKSYLRYVAGQRFGYMNPNFVLNRLDTLVANPYDTIRRPVRFRGLFDVKMEHPDDSFFAQAMERIGMGTDSLTAFLKSVQPENPFYRVFKEKLNRGGLSKGERVRVLVNMERSRWRQKDNIWNHQKYVVVNIPAYQLMAVDGQDTLTMRIGCGSLKTKTPLLNSHIKRMDINPKWFVPRSIILHDMARHAGNPGYFLARNYYVRDVKTGEEVDLHRVTRAMLVSGACGVVQRGGKGNALGRIIFRFDNNFSVYLHDTSSRGVFEREERGVSHGCIRIEKPYDFAVFLLAEKNRKLMDKIKYSMTDDSLSNRKMVVNGVKVKPEVPLFITYYTLYPLAGGRTREYPDVYGYDKVIWEHLKRYL